MEGSREYIGFQPYSHQRAVIDELRDAWGTGKVVAVLSSRQKGKSFMIANLLLYYAINRRNTKNFCLSPTLKQARAIYSTIYDVLFSARLILKSNATDLEIKLINKSIISFKSAEMREALRGYTADFLCIDEACYISDNVFYTVLPWVDAKKAPLLMVSTPFVKEGFFYRYYNYGLERTNSTVTIDWSDERFRFDMERILPPEKLEEYRRVIPENQFRSEYLGQWLDTDGQVFSGFRERILNASPSPGDRLFVGIDWASGVDMDDTVVAAFNQDGRQVMLDVFNNLSATQQIDRIMALLGPWERQIVRLQPELNGVGQPMTDLLRTRLRKDTLSRVHGFTTTNQSKAEIVAQLQVAFEQGTVSIWDDERQLRELGVYAAEYNPRTKNVYYNAPQGLHDDIPMALMLAWDARIRNNAAGGYTFGGGKIRMRI